VQLPCQARYGPLAVEGCQAAGWPVYMVPLLGYCHCSEFAPPGVQHHASSGETTFSAVVQAVGDTFCCCCCHGRRDGLCKAPLAGNVHEVGAWLHGLGHLLQRHCVLTNTAVRPAAFVFSLHLFGPRWHSYRHCMTSCPGTTFWLSQGTNWFAS
jgi:hypothetical protein